jgi:hypothetical protein
MADRKHKLYFFYIFCGISNNPYPPVEPPKKALLKIKYQIIFLLFTPGNPCEKERERDNHLSFRGNSLNTLKTAIFFAAERKAAAVCLLNANTYVQVCKFAVNVGSPNLYWKI